MVISMLNKIINIVEQAGEIYKNACNDLNDLGIEDKGSSVNLVTKYDKMIQDFLFDELAGICPGCSFLGEEGSDNKELTDGYCFIIDPIDGTTNFIKGFEHSAISVGLAKNKELIIGVVLDPDLNNIYYAEKGKGAFLNGKQIFATQNKMENSVVLFGTCPYDRELGKKTFKLTENIFYNSLEIRRSGSAALDICYVAAGKADLYYELKISPWDLAGATVVLKEAGGIYKTVDNKNIDYSSATSYVCGNENNLKEFFNTADGIL